METLPAQMLYEIYKFLGLPYIAILECFSTSIQKKLEGTLSAMNYILRKNNCANVSSLQEAKDNVKMICIVMLYKFQPG